MSQFKLTSLIDEAQIQNRVRQLGEEITKDFANRDLLAVCVLKGSFVFYADLVRQIDLDFACDFISCSSYSGTESTGEVKLQMDIANSVKGKDVLLIEDIVDSGLTVQYLRSHILARQPASLAVASLLFKPQCLRCDVQLDYVGFEIGDNFVVGYGLDYQNQFRSVPYIAEINNFQ